MQNFKKRFRNEAEFERQLEVAKKHVSFCLQLYKIQIKESRHFVHEYPNNAMSWAMPKVQALASMLGVLAATCDM